MTRNVGWEDAPPFVLLPSFPLPIEAEAERTEVDALRLSPDDNFFASDSLSLVCVQVPVRAVGHDAEDV